MAGPGDHQMGGGFAASRKAANVLLEQADREVARGLTELASFVQHSPRSTSQPPAPSRQSPLYPLSTASYGLLFTSTGVSRGVCSTSYVAGNVVLNAGTSRTGTRRPSACGHLADLGANYCSQCGKRIKWMDA